MYKNGTKCGLISKLYIVLLLTALIGNASVLAAEASDPAGPLPQYDYIEPFSEGLAAARERTTGGDLSTSSVRSRSRLSTARCPLSAKALRLSGSKVVTDIWTKTVIL